MKRVVLGNFVGVITVFIVNGVIFYVVKPFTDTEVIILWAGSVIASLVALRVWSRTEITSHSSAWWLLVAMVSALIGALLFWIDILFGFIVQPIEMGGGILGSISNPLAVLISLAFLPYQVSVAIASAVRAAILKRD